MSIYIYTFNIYWIYMCIYMFNQELEGNLRLPKIFWKRVTGKHNLINCNVTCLL